MDRPIKILYVEDEPFLGKIVSESLSSRGFELQLVADGRHALSAFHTLMPDICVLDVMLPHRDGFAIGQDIRALNPSIPIIYLTAKAQTDDVLKGFSSGGNDYVRKPFSMEELIVRINNLLQLSGIAPSSRPGTDQVIELGDYRFFPARQELVWAGQARRLSHRESELLSLLTEKRHELVTRKEILDRIWGNDSFFNSRNLDVYITRLRDYLREDPNVQIITLKGVGYRVVGL